MESFNGCETDLHDVVAVRVPDQALDLAWRTNTQRIFKCCVGGLVGLFKDAFWKRIEARPD